MRKGKKQNRSKGIKRKVHLGFTLLAFILFFSGVISVFDFFRMNNELSGRIAENINNVNRSRDLMTLSEDFNTMLLLNLNDDEEDLTDRTTYNRDTLTASFNAIKKTLTSSAERRAADSVLYAYTAYMQVTHEAQDIWLQGYDVRKEWYFNRLQPVFITLQGYIRNLTAICHDELEKNAGRQQETFYRSIMPSVVSVAVGLILILLFNFYMNYYILNPILKMNKNLQNHRKYGSEYTVKVDSDDEIADLNATISELVQDNAAARHKH